MLPPYLQNISSLRLAPLQRIFVIETSYLIQHIYNSGYECSFGDTFRDPRVFGEPGIQKGYGHSRSCHKIRLAVDLNLFKNGAFLGDTSEHKIFGDWWKSRSPIHTWGGDFNDGNHYSFTYNGMK